jgi:predicted dehydrogenase
MKQDSSNLNDARETRRSFIRKSSIAAAAVASAANIFKTPVYGQTQAPSTGRVIGANDRIVMGYIGVGGQGMAHVRTQKKDAAANNIAQVAVCDLSKHRQQEAKKFIDGNNVEMYEDYRKLLDRKDIDAVTIATVDHWHTKCSIEAMESGKHVYCEKPMTRYLTEAFDFHDAVKRTGKIFQLGSQGCSAAGWHKAAEMIQAGKIGQMVWAQGYYCRNNPAGEWNYTIHPWCTEADLNWNEWQKPVKRKGGFNADAYFRWRKYYPYCAGLLGDLVPHRLNPLMLATGNPEYPKRVVSIGTKSVGSDKNTQGTPARDVPEHVEILAEFPSGVILTVVCSTVAAKSPGFVIYGHKASLDIGSSGESIQVTVEQPYAEGGKFEDAKLENQTIKGLTPTEDIGAHERNWFECIRANNPKTNANIDLATKAQTVISLAEMSQRLNMACMFDEKTRKVTTENGKAVKPITYGTLELS